VPRDAGHRGQRVLSRLSWRGCVLRPWTPRSGASDSSHHGKQCERTCQPVRHRPAWLPAASPRGHARPRRRRRRHCCARSTRTGHASPHHPGPPARLRPCVQDTSPEPATQTRTALPFQIRRWLTAACAGAVEGGRPSACARKASTSARCCRSRPTWRAALAAFCLAPSWLRNMCRLLVNAFIAAPSAPGKDGLVGRAAGVGWLVRRPANAGHDHSVRPACIPLLALSAIKGPVA
jgi:hypothetical protein